MDKTKEREEILKGLQHIYHEHLRLLEYLLQNDEDVDIFKKEYKYSEQGDVQNIYDFRILQRLRKSMTKSFFLKCYECNKKEALEKLFQEPLTDKEVQIFIQYDKPLAEVYQLSTDNLSIQLLSLLEFWDFVKNKRKINSFVDF